MVSASWSLTLIVLVACCCSVLATAPSNNNGKHNIDGNDDHQHRQNMMVYDPNYSHFPNVKRTHTVLDNGYHHVQHTSDFSRTYPHPTKRNRTATSYVKLHSSLTHAPHWRFVCLNNETITHCGRDRLVVSRPSQGLLRMLSILKGDLVHHTSIVIHSTAHACVINNTKEGLFRSIESFESSADNSELTFTSHKEHNHMAHFVNVFPEADIRLDTNILPRSATTIIEHPGDGVVIPHTTTSSHHMHQLWGLSSITSAIRDCAKTIVPIATAVISRVAQGESISSIVSNIDYEKNSPLDAFEWGQQREAIYKLDTPSTFNLAASSQANLAVNVKASNLRVQMIIQIRKANLQSIQLSLTGDAVALARLKASFAGQSSAQWSKKVMTYQPPSIGVAPIFYIQPTITVSVGLIYSVDSQFAVNQVIETIGSFKGGLALEGELKPSFAHGFREMKPKWDQLSANGSFYIESYLELGLDVQITGIATAVGTARTTAQGSGAVSTFSGCQLLFTLNMYPKLALEVTINKFTLAGVVLYAGGKILNQQWPLPPIPVYSVCLTYKKTPAPTKLITAAPTAAPTQRVTAAPTPAPTTTLPPTTLPPTTLPPPTLPPTTTPPKTDAATAAPTAIPTTTTVATAAPTDAPTTAAPPTTGAPRTKSVPYNGTDVPAPTLIGSLIGLGFTSSSLGTVFEGTVMPSRQRAGCNIQKRVVSLQIADVTSTSVVFVGTVKSDLTEGTTKMQQLAYEMTLSTTQEGKIDFTRSTNPQYDVSRSASDDTNDTKAEELDYLSGVLDPSLQSIYLNPLSVKDTCPTFTLMTPPMIIPEEMRGKSTQLTCGGGSVTRDSLSSDVASGRNVFDVYIPDYNGLNITALPFLVGCTSGNFKKSYSVQRDGVELCTCVDTDKEVICSSSDGEVCIDLETTGSYQIVVTAPTEPNTNRPYCMAATCWSTQYAAADNENNGGQGSSNSDGLSGRETALITVTALCCMAVIVVGYMWMRERNLRTSIPVSDNSVIPMTMSLNSYCEMERQSGSDKKTSI